jgi:polyhydroxyalkanoate synthase
MRPPTNLGHAVSSQQPCVVIMIWITTKCEVTGEVEVTESAPSIAMLDMLGVAETMTTTGDPVSFLRALVSAGLALPRHPGEVAQAVGQLAVGSIAALGATARRSVGDLVDGPRPTAPSDRRFGDPAFAQNPYYFAACQAHLLAEQFAQHLVTAAELPAEKAEKAAFAAKFLLDLLAPTNTLLGNPAALRTAFDTGGKSLVRGARNLVHDLRHNGGWPSQVDASPFEVGVNMAATKGKVVYRSDLIELIQYEPTTTQVYSVPLLFCPPWINKYYIMDLAPGKSLIEWAVAHGHTCFVISYRNPDEAMRDTGFQDYLMKGPLAAIDVVREITGAPQVNLLSVCLGGTLSAVGLAYLAREDRDLVNSATFINSHTDFSIPGAMGLFTDESTIAGLERKMAKLGYLDASEMARTFDALRANDLIFAYLINNWLLGKNPPSFDLLAWNADSTRMPAKMHSTYLRSFYLRNEFARGEFMVAGAPVDAGACQIESYVLSAVDDHIVPWQSAYKTTQILGGKARFVLSTSGHIAGIVNPPSPKAKHWTNDATPIDTDAWLKDASLHEQTWWIDWADWISTRAGRKTRARKALGSDKHPAIDDAPGQYVRVRSH